MAKQSRQPRSPAKKKRHTKHYDVPATPTKKRTKKARAAKGASAGGVGFGAGAAASIDMRPAAKRLSRLKKSEKAGEFPTKGGGAIKYKRASRYSNPVDEKGLFGTPRRVKKKATKKPKNASKKPRRSR
jgi:hypothetical protein